MTTVARFWQSKLYKWRFWLEQLTLQKRLVIAYILILLLPSVTISIYIFRGFTGNTIEELKKSSLNALEIEQVHINNNMETMKRAMELSTIDFEVLDYLGKRFEPSVQELIEMDRIQKKGIVRLLYNNPSLDQIRIYMSNSNTYEIWPVFYYEKRIRQELWYEPVMKAAGSDVWVFSGQNRELLQSGLHDILDPNPKISLFRELQYPTGTHVGILEIDMRLANFFPNTFTPLQEEESQMVVLDREGGVFRYPGSGFLDKSGLTFPVLRQQFSALNESAEGTGSFDFRAGGKPFLAVYSYIEPLQAYMVKLVSLEHVYKGINDTRNRILLANVILLVILSLSTYIMNAIILKKLHVLTDSVKKVRQGDFNFDVDIRGGGEVGELAHHFRKMLRKMGELIAEAVNKQAAAKEAELATLKNQIDSHFLYNTLENIKMMAEVHDHREISDALTSLGSMMRYNMRWTSEYVRLRDEISHIGNYINIANVRFDNKVTLVTDIPEAFLDQELLKMSLQPVVENSVKHGLQNREMTIGIQAEATGDAMMISITDDGSGMTAEQVEVLNRRIQRSDGRLPAVSDGEEPFRQGHGIGLANVHSRIQMHYGKEYGLQIDSAEGRYTRVTIRIPHFILGGRLSGHAEAADRG